jgi:uncharacterized OB-fold protein
MNTLRGNLTPRAPLIGARCRACGAVFFPVRASCESCGASELLETPLPRTGTVWTWTTQSYPPPSPPYFRRETRETYIPYAVAYVQLADVLVLGRIEPSRSGKLEIGARVELVSAALAPAASLLADVPCFAVTP